LTVWDRKLNVDAFKVDRHLCGVGRHGVLVVAVVGPCDRATLADSYGPWPEAERAAAGEAESCWVEVSDVYDANASL
jgi:hypothetical protein